MRERASQAESGGRVPPCETYKLPPNLNADCSVDHFPSSLLLNNQPTTLRKSRMSSSGQSSTRNDCQNASAITTKPKKKLNRQLASCSGCRSVSKRVAVLNIKRRTRCDRVSLPYSIPGQQGSTVERTNTVLQGRPCSECHKRNVACDYTGASGPPSITHAAILEQVQREEYIKQLEARLQALEKSAPSANNNCSPSPSTTPQDFTVDDLASQLSIMTMGKRARGQMARKDPHPLRTQLESILASQSNIPPITFILPEQQFTLDLVAKYPVPNLKELCSEYLPPRSQLDFLSEYYFNTLNLWSPCINRIDWNIQLDAFWNSKDRLGFRPPCPPDPPHITQHFLAQFVSVIYGIIGHGLARLADIHHLECPAENQSSAGSSASSPPRDYQLWSLNQAEKISLSNRWFRFSLGLLTSPEGNIYVKPTLFGIRAMHLLSNVEHAPENIDHGIFFWSLTSSLAMSAGLYREPPISDDENMETLDEIEVESRRQLAWSILGLECLSLNNAQSILSVFLSYKDSIQRLTTAHPCEIDYLNMHEHRRINYRIMSLHSFRSLVSQISVKIPGTVLTPTTPLHPTDGCPLDPLLCIRKLAAQMDQAMRQSSIRITSGQPATYQEIRYFKPHFVIEAQRRIYEVESLIPHRLQAGISADGKSLETVIKNDPVYILLAAVSLQLSSICLQSGLLSRFLHARFCIPQIRLLRLFILPKTGVPPEERIKQLQSQFTPPTFHSSYQSLLKTVSWFSSRKSIIRLTSPNVCFLFLLLFSSHPELLTVSKRHFLASEYFPHSLSMHPLVLYGLINTAIACALVLLINFFLSQLQKLMALFDMGKKTIAATMARKAVTLLQTLIKQIELRSGSAGSKSWDRRKRGPGVAVETSHNSQYADGDDAVNKHKQQVLLHSLQFVQCKYHHGQGGRGTSTLRTEHLIPTVPNVSSKPHEPERFHSLSYGFVTLSADSSQAVRHNRHESEHAAKPTAGSSTSLGSTSPPGLVPIHTSPSVGFFPPALSSSEAPLGQPTPPLVSSQPSRRPGFSTRSSSSQFSSTHNDACLDRSNSSPSFRAVASLPRHLHLGSNVEFGTIDAQLDNYQFHFPTRHSSAGYGKSGGSQKRTGADEGTVNLRDEPNLLNIFDAGFLLHIPNWTTQTENHTSTQLPEFLPINAGDLEYFQPTFNAENFTGIADAGVLSSTDLAGPVDPGRFSFSSHYEGDTGINKSE
ncbi:hypothetical protein VP01_1241g1 [Puccinia sorghi]|uniref:Transcription factor domain-containing protein n=1 Tax=Puccinia sorghi TaxID=27349 RepID=A0A0L6VPL8_9BASI|nr:hypothetical protein VP01_1241g1 [Puccinia sorghi]